MCSIRGWFVIKRSHDFSFSGPITWCKAGLCFMQHACKSMFAAGDGCDQMTIGKKQAVGIDQGT